jgi:4-amino-4-deoxy-L-arabinose transferase-like glycosyltransferase
MANAKSGLREKLSASAFQETAHEVIQWWDSVAGRRHAVLLIVGVWAVVAVPLVFLRGYHSVEGVTVTVARSAVEDGHWLTPYMYNVRWVERPTLLSWIIAAISLPFGHVNLLTSRLPNILALLAGCLLIWRALRPVASAGAALLGAALFLSCPIVMRFYAISLADVPLAVILFGAFFLWWNSFVTGRISVGRWIVIGGLLAIAALMKGPQPVAYFILGLGVFSLLTSSWWQIPGLLLAGLISIIPASLWYAYVFVPGDQSNWLKYMRLSSGRIAGPHPLRNAVLFFFEAFPAALLASALLVARDPPFRKTVPPQFVLALSCYAFVGTLVILFWPAAVASRYVFPMLLPLCVLGGIAYDALSERWPVFIASVICIVMGSLGYATIYSTIAAPLMPTSFRPTEIWGNQLTEFVRSAPAPVFRTELAGLNELPYTSLRVTDIDPTSISSLSRPAWIVVPAEEADAIIAKSNGHMRSVFVFRRSALLRLE